MNQPHGAATLATGTRPPVAPPKAWFSNPSLTELTPLTVTPDGRVFGHLASWNSCHMDSAAIGGSCVRAPKSKNNYASFHLGYVTTAEGVDVPTGRIIAGAPHADPVWSLDPTLVHYSHSGWVGADVRAGEDKFGIWVAGAVRSDVTPEQLRSLKASPLSGDWRTDPKTGGLELVAALAVNSPGFAIPRPTALIASAGGVRSLVAVGVVQRGVVARDPLDARMLRVRAERVRRQFPKPVRERTVGELRSLVASLALGRERALVASLNAPGANVIPWQGILGAEGLPTGDGRLIDPGALSVATFPLPLRWAASDMGGHDGAVVVGSINSVQRGADGLIHGSGVIDLGSPEGREVARQINGGFAGGVSFDLDSVDQATLFAPVTPEAPVATDEPAGSPDTVVSAGRIRGATLVAIPAFDEARIELSAPYDPAALPIPALLVEDSGDEDSGDPEDCGCTDTIDTVPEDAAPAAPTAPATPAALPGLDQFPTLDDMKTLAARVNAMRPKEGIK